MYDVIITNAERARLLRLLMTEIASEHAAVVQLIEKLAGTDVRLIAQHQGEPGGENVVIGTVGAGGRVTLLEEPEVVKADPKRTWIVPDRPVDMRRDLEERARILSVDAATLIRRAWDEHVKLQQTLARAREAAGFRKTPLTDKPVGVTPIPFVDEAELLYGDDGKPRGFV